MDTLSHLRTHHQYLLAVNSNGM